MASILFLIAALLLLLWKVLCLSLRARRSRYLASLHPTEDALLLVKLTNFVEFPFLSNIAFDFVMLRVLAIPYMSKLLHAAKLLNPSSALKRYDDTNILVEEFELNHVDSPRGSLAIGRLNFIHAQYKISNASYLHTLSVIVLERIRLAAKYGFREWTEGEKRAYFVVWRDIGTCMGIRDIPHSLEELDRFKTQYEAQKMIYADSNKEMGDARVDLLLCRAPALLRPLARRVVFALLDERFLDAMGYPRQPFWLVWTAEKVVRFWCGTLVRWFLPPRPLSWSRERIPLEEGEETVEKVYKVRHDVYKPGSYPNGYRISELGHAQAGRVGKAAEGSLLCPLRFQKKRE